MRTNPVLCLDVSLDFRRLTYRRQSRCGKPEFDMRERILLPARKPGLHSSIAAGCGHCCADACLQLHLRAPEGDSGEQMGIAGRLSA